MERDWPSDTAALLKLGENNHPQNYWTINDAFQGTQIFGSSGSGKTSGSGAHLARAFLKANFGGVVLTAKTDERQTWEKYAREAGRTRDLLIFSEENYHRFNFLQYECERKNRGSGNTENLVNLFCTVMEVADRKSSTGGEGYWIRAVKQLLRNAFDLMALAETEINLPDLYKLITSAPNSVDEVADPSWQSNSICWLLIERAKDRTTKAGKETDFLMTEAYWLREFARLANDTKTAIVNMFTSMADCFLRGLMREMFCGKTTFTPEDCFDKGKIIILDFPVKEYHELGIFSQVIFKYVWQRAVERRIPPMKSREELQSSIRPVFLWADESVFFCNENDAAFQATARSSRACTVYLTQNLPGYQTAFMSAGGKSAAETFLGNLQTKIFHTNGDPQTNNWAADSIGRVRQAQIHTGFQQGEQNRHGSQNAGSSFSFEYSVQPQEFTGLMTGGVENDGQVECFIFQAGRSWLQNRNSELIERNYLRHTFKQF